MNRRKVLQNLSMGLGGVMTLPSWANAWTPGKLQRGIALTTAEGDLLTELSETMIPETDTPGAKTLEVSKFIKAMVLDCHDKKDQDRFKTGLTKVDEVSRLIYGKPFTESSKEQKLHLLQGLEMSYDPDHKWFFGLVKRLTTQGYTSSEYFLTNIAKFEFAPARFHGCVPLIKQS